MGYWEPRFAEKFNRCTTVSEEDYQLLKKANPQFKNRCNSKWSGCREIYTSSFAFEKCYTFPNVYWKYGIPAMCRCCDIFLQRDFSSHPAINGSTEMWIVGRDPRPEVLHLAGKSVYVTGRVEDVIPYYQKAHVCVVPLRAGGGTRLKILEAMALGRPVVSTTIGCEGLEVKDGVNILIANSPMQFAEKLNCFCVTLNSMSRLL